MATTNGYAKQELYLEMRKQIYENNYASAFCMAAELASTKNELLNVIDFIIAFIAEYHLMWNQDVVETCLFLIQVASSYPSRTRIMQEDVQRALCKTFMRIVLDPNRKHTEYITKDVPVDVVLKVETLGTHPTIHKHFGKYLRHFEKVIGIHVYKDMCALLYHVRKAREREVTHIVTKLIMAKDIAPYYPIDYDEIANISVNARKDIVWVLWKGLLNYISKTVKDHRIMEHVVRLMKLYSYKYARKCRLKRIHLLYAAYIGVCDPNKWMNKRLSSSQSYIAEEAVDKCVVVFDEVLESSMANVEEDDLGDHAMDMLEQVPDKHHSMFYDAIRSGTRIIDQAKLQKKKKRAKEKAQLAKARAKSEAKAQGKKKGALEDENLPIYMRMYTCVDT